MGKATRPRQTIQKMESNEIIQVQQADMLQAINRSEVDIQIATAKQYPRDIQGSLNNILTIATLNEKTAADCFYALRKGGEVIEGVSVRLAEIIAGSWGNLRVQTRIIGNDGKTITAQGVCLDLQTNYAASVEVKRRITDKHGRTYSEDMQVVTGNAASAIAFRNAILKVVPKALTDSIVEEIRRVAIGKSKDIETSRKNMVDYFGKLGVTKEQLLAYLKVSSMEDVDAKMVFELRGLANALKEGSTTLQESFPAVAKESEDIAAAARKKAQDSQSKAAQAMAAASGKKPAEVKETAKNDAPEEEVDKETGEIKTKKANVNE